MNSLLTKLIGSKGAQDGAAIVRGVWRVIDAATKDNNSEVYGK